MIMALTGKLRVFTSPGGPQGSWHRHRSPSPLAGPTRAHNPNVMTVQGSQHVAEHIERAGSPLSWRASSRAGLVAALQRLFASNASHQPHLANHDLFHNTDKRRRPAKQILALDDRTLADIGIDRHHALWLTYAQPRQSWWRRV